MTEKPYPDHFIEWRNCPGCGQRQNALKFTDDNADVYPPEGTFAATICDQCGYAMAIDPDLTIRELTDEERAECEANPSFHETRQAFARERH
jgi:hypothetical protein